MDPSVFETHSLRRTKATLIYRRTGNLRAVQLLLGHTKVESTVRYLGIEVDDATMMRTRKQCQFEAMRQHESQLGPRNAHFQSAADSPYFVKESARFIRRGEVGDGLATMTEAQLAAYQERFDRTLGGFELVADYR